MIVVRLMGGLGNQLFQYAAGRALSLKHKTELQFDLTYLKANSNQEYTQRNLELDLFDLQIHEVSQENLSKFKSNSFFQKVTRKLFGNTFSKYHIANQDEFKFLPEFNAYSDNIYLNGYWQSEKYFLNIRETLLKELIVKKVKSLEVINAEKEILNSTSVSLHIRRGDYVSRKESTDLHGILSLDYFYNAIKEVKKKNSEITVYVFSDDISWVKENLKITDKCVYVDFNTGDNSVFDLYLMSLCKHNIIANSSFSWWGAWLNQNPEKIVIAPKNWFAKKELKYNDVIPDSWIQL